MPFSLQDAKDGLCSLFTFESSYGNSFYLLSKEGKVLGCIGTEHWRPDCDTVANSVAKKGWGPLMYDLAMSKTTSQGVWLTSDRNQTSDRAQKVWNFYYNRRPDVMKLSFPRECDHRKYDWNTALNHGYKLKNLLIPTELVNNAEATGWDKGEVIRKGNRLFDRSQGF